jgi:hypothetical protein
MTLPDKEALKTYIHEQQRFHDELTGSFHKIGTKIITYIGATLALLVFLYSGALDSAKPTLDRLFIPDELYGKLFYFLGLFLVLYALTRLIHGSRPGGHWTVACNSSDLTTVESMTDTEYLVKLKNDYDEARIANAKEHTKKYEALRDAFYPLLLGATIMIVLRYFQ